MKNTTSTTSTRGYSLEQLAVLHDLLTIAATTPREVADVFFYYSPHVEQIDVTIHPGGWTKDGSSLFRYEADIDVPSAVGLRDLHANVVSRLNSINGRSLIDVRADKAAKLRAQAEALIAEANELTAEPPALEAHS